MLVPPRDTVQSEKEHGGVQSQKYREMQTLINTEAWAKEILILDNLSCYCFGVIFHFPIAIKQADAKMNW